MHEDGRGWPGPNDRGIDLGASWAGQPEALGRGGRPPAQLGRGGRRRVAAEAEVVAVTLGKGRSLVQLASMIDSAMTAASK